jgi:hypothetical protein
MEVEIDYKPRNWAKTLHDSTKRWMVMVLHRRAGKTTAVINHLQRDAIRVKGSIYAYIAPTYKQAKRIAWDIAKNIARPIPGVEFNEAELTIKYPNGSKIYLLGSENIDALRGMALWGGGQDEAPQHPPTLFSEVVSKCLADHLGYWIFFGTPKGKGYFYQIYKNSLSDERWTCIFKTIDDSLKEEEGETIQNLRIALEDDRRLVSQGLMTIDEFNQEWYNSFEAAIKGAYYSEQIALARNENRIKLVPYDRELKVHTVWDLGVGQALGVGFYQVLGNEPRMIDYWEGEGNQGITEAIKALQNKPYIYGKHFAPHDVNAKEVSSGKTRKETAAIFGINFEVVPKARVDDGIEKGKLFFGRLYIDTVKCEKWLDAVSQYRRDYDEDKNMFIEKPRHDWTSHAADVHRYASLVEKEMNTEEPVITQPKQQPISEFEGRADLPESDEIFDRKDLANW